MEKRVWEVAERYTVCAQLLFEIRAKDSCFNPRGTGASIHPQHSPQASHIKGHRHASGFHSLHAAGNIRPSAKGDHHHVTLGRGAKRQAHLALAFWIDDQIRRTDCEAAAKTKQIAESFAISVNHALFRLIGDLSGSKERTQSAQEPFVDPRLRQFDGSEFPLWRPEIVSFNLKSRFRIRPETRMGADIEFRVLVSPTPPLHMPGFVGHISSLNRRRNCFEKIP